MSNPVNPFRRSQPSLRRQSTREMLRDFDALMDRLRLAREQRNIEPNAMADRLQTSEENLLAYESGTAFPGLDFIFAYAGAMGVHVDISTQNVREWKQRQDKDDYSATNKLVSLVVEKRIRRGAPRGGMQNWRDHRAEVLDG